MNEALAKKILTKLRPSPEGVPGNEHYQFVQYGFYDFEEISGLSRGEYEKFMVSMAQQDWIVIDFKNGIGYEKAVVSATSIGVTYLEGN